MFIASHRTHLQRNLHCTLEPFFVSAHDVANTPIFTFTKNEHVCASIIVDGHDVQGLGIIELTTMVITRYSIAWSEALASLGCGEGCVLRMKSWMNKHSANYFSFGAFPTV